MQKLHILIDLRICATGYGKWNLHTGCKKKRFFSFFLFFKFFFKRVLRGLPNTNCACAKGSVLVPFCKCLKTEFLNTGFPLSVNVQISPSNISITH